VKALAFSAKAREAISTAGGTIEVLGEKSVADEVAGA
jgi:ribosomal protein L18E